MFQIPAGARSGKIIAADITAHVFAASPAGLVLLKAGAANAGTVTILGVRSVGSVDTPDSDGYPLAAGDPLPTVVLNGMDQIAYQFSNAGDLLHWIRLK